MARLGLVQEDLAAPLGVTTRAAVGHYMTSRRRLSVDQAVALARALDVSMDWLFSSGQHPATGSASLAHRIDRLPPEGRALLEGVLRLTERLPADEVADALRGRVIPLDPHPHSDDVG